MSMLRGEIHLSFNDCQIKRLWWVSLINQTRETLHKTEWYDSITVSSSLTFINIADVDTR